MMRAGNSDALHVGMIQAARYSMEGTAQHYPEIPTLPGPPL